MHNIDDYAKWTIETAVYPGAGTGDIAEIVYLTLGLSGESGKTAEKLKKYLREDTDDYATRQDLIDKMKPELGDVIYYWCRLCHALNLRPSDVIDANRQKLLQRKNEGKLKGSGDAR